MTKKLICFLIILTLIFSGLTVLTGCGSDDVPLPESFTLKMNEVKFTTPRDTKVLYDGEVSAEEITWGSDDTSVATVENGVVTAVGPGTTEVYAEYFGMKRTCFVDCSTLVYTADLIPEQALTTNEYGGDAVLAPPKSFDGASTYFNDAAFIGDSISLKLSYYAESSGEFGDALFLVSGSYGVGNAVDGAMQVYYQGQDTTPEDALAKSGVKKVFIMLGMNDLARFGLDGTIEYWEKFVANIREKNPDIVICIQSMTPVWYGGEVGDLNNQNIDQYNEKLKQFASDNGCAFFDIAPFMKDSNNALATDYCSDNFVHLTDAGARAWTMVLKAYIGY